MIYGLVPYEAPVISEYQECKCYWKWAQTNPITAEYLVKHVNEGQRQSWYVKALQYIGMRKGLPDYQLIWPNQNWGALWIEMKRRDEKSKCGKRTEHQQRQDEWIERLKSAKHYATYAYGWEDAMRITNEYLTDKI